MNRNTCKTKRPARSVAQSAKAGFTLVELLLYISLSAVILVATSLFIQLVLESRIKNSVVIEVNEQGRQAMEMITRAITNADSITVPSINTTGSTLTLAMASAPLNPTVFSVSSGVLQIKEGAGPEIPLTNSKVTVTSIVVSNLSRASTPGSVRVEFTLSSVNPSGRNEYSFTRTFTSSATLR